MSSEEKWYEESDNSYRDLKKLRSLRIKHGCECTVIRKSLKLKGPKWTFEYQREEGRDHTDLDYDTDEVLTTVEFFRQRHKIEPKDLGYRGN